jgi:hypothetical protein
MALVIIAFSRVTFNGHKLFPFIGVTGLFFVKHGYVIALFCAGKKVPSEEELR